MAQWIDSDAATNGTGTEASPYNVGSSLNLYTGDIIYVKGSADILIEATGTTNVSCFFLNWAGTTKRATRVILSAEGSGYFRAINVGIQAYGVHIAQRNNSTSTYAPIRDTAYVNTFDCKLSTLAGTGAAHFACSNDLYGIVSHCELDLTNVESWVKNNASLSSGSFINNEIHSFSNQLNPAFKVNGNAGMIFRNNKFFNMDTPQGIFYPDQSDECPLIEHNTFWITDNNTPIFNANDFSASTKPFNFYGNVVAYQSSQGFILNLSAENIGFAGSNLFYNATLGLYAPRTGLTDQTDTSNPFKSTTQGDSDFLELSNTSNGKFADAIYPNTDIGAVQGVGNVLFPPTGKVEENVVFGNGVNGDRTGTKTDPAAADVRSGTTWGDPDDLQTGSLAAFDPDDVIESGGGNYREVPNNKAEAGFDYGAPSSPETGSATLLIPAPTYTEITVFTSDGSDISGTDTTDSKIYNVQIGTKMDDFLTTIGVSERVANSDAVVSQNVQNQNFLQVELIR